MSNKKIITIVAVLLLVVLAASAFYMMNTKNDDSNSKTCTTYGNRVEEQCIEDYIGLSQDEAVSRAEQHNYTPKIVSIDGVEQGFTDEGSTPIYIEIENGIVTGGYFEEGRKSQ